MICLSILHWKKTEKMDRFLMSWKYIAGFVDGEGCISVRKYDNRKYKSKGKHKSHGFRGEIQFGQSQKQDKVMYVISEFLTEKEVQHTFYADNRKKCPMTIIKMGNKKHLIKILKKIMPYIIVKHLQATKLMKFCKGDLKCVFT